jgi:hypothetical protein
VAEGHAFRHADNLTRHNLLLSGVRRTSTKDIRLPIDAKTLSSRSDAKPKPRPEVWEGATILPINLYNQSIAATNVKKPSKTRVKLNK